MEVFECKQTTTKTVQSSFLICVCARLLFHIYWDFMYMYIYMYYIYIFYYPYVSTYELIRSFIHLFISLFICFLSECFVYIHFSVRV